MIPILANAEVQQRLLPFLPEGEVLPRSEEELRNTVQSPQFQQVQQTDGSPIAHGCLKLLSATQSSSSVAHQAHQPSESHNVYPTKHCLVLACC